MVVILFSFPSREHRVWKRRLHFKTFKNLVATCYLINLMSQILINYLASLHRRVRTRPASRWTHRWWKRTCHHSPSDVGPRMERNGTCEVGMRPIAWWCAKNIPVNIAIENHLQIGVLIGTSSLSLSLWVISIATVEKIGEYIEQNPNVPILEDKTI